MKSRIWPEGGDPPGIVDRRGGRERRKTKARYSPPSQGCRECWQQFHLPTFLQEKGGGRSLFGRRSEVEGVLAAHVLEKLRNYCHRKHFSFVGRIPII
jgi:hypothetical protein